METTLHGISGDVVVVTSDLQAARPNFATPDAAVLQPMNAQGSESLAGSVRGGAFIITGIHWNVVAAAAGVGFRLDGIFDGATTVLFNFASQAAGTWMGSWTGLYRPLRAPYIKAGPTAISGARIAMALNGAPGALSWLQLDLLHHTDIGLKGTLTYAGTDAAL